MLVTRTLALPSVRALLLDGAGADDDDVPSGESLLAPPVTNAPPVFDAALPSWDGATHTALVVSPEPPADEPEWLTIDPWTLEAVREYDARCA